MDHLARETSAPAQCERNNIRTESQRIDPLSSGRLSMKSWVLTYEIQEKIATTKIIITKSNRIITKFSTVIGHPRTYFLRNRRAGIQLQLFN